MVLLENNHFILLNIYLATSTSSEKWILQKIAYKHGSPINKNKYLDFKQTTIGNI